MATTSHDYKSKIELLLVKAAGTDNEEERDAYTAKAQRLMLKWGIEEADLEARGEVKPEQVVQERRSYSGALAETMPQFANNLAHGMGGLKVLKNTYGKHHIVYVIGHQSDVDNFWLMMNSLEQQARVGCKAWWKKAPESEWIKGWDRYKAHRDFVTAFGAVCGRRLRTLRTEVQQDATPGAALVLVSKDERVEEKYQELHPKVRTSRGLSGGISGWSAGADAGSRAHLGGKGISGAGSAGALS